MDRESEIVLDGERQGVKKNPSKTGRHWKERMRDGGTEREGEQKSGEADKKQRLIDAQTDSLLT